ncbi:MAG: YajQ family cyclic di-GMP-binding protein [Candidatus Saccharibacteria bacterium]|nr:YajQ family cyclic di-GMP-binding protein [Candidatus Saccharibacteria bacterium]
MANFSLDIVSDYDKAEINNVFDQVQREMANRYDFKGTPATVEWLNDDKAGLKVIGDSDMQIDAILDIVRKKLGARNQSQKVLDTSKESVTTNMKTSKEVPFIQGLDQDKAKQITKIIREEFPKAKTQIQGQEVRVTSNSKDNLQAIMKLLRSKDFDFPLNFTNFR